MRIKHESIVCTPKPVSAYKWHAKYKKKIHAIDMHFHETGLAEKKA